MNQVGKEVEVILSHRKDLIKYKNKIISLPYIIIMEQIRVIKVVLEKICKTILGKFNQ